MRASTCAIRKRPFVLISNTNHAVRMHRRYDVEELRLQQGFAAEPHHAHAAHAIARKLVFHEGHHVCE